MKIAPASVVFPLPKPTVLFLLPTHTLFAR